MSEIEEKLMEKYQKKKETSNTDALIWAITIILALLVLAIGIIDFNLSMRFEQGVEGFPVTSYDRVTGEPVDVYPVFGIAAVPTGNNGLIPPTIGLNINDWIVMSVIVLTGVPAFAIFYRKAKTLKKIDDNLPYLLREIADSQRIGMHLPRAIHEASKRNYGPLTPELKKLAAKISWGISFRKAMTAFRDNINTPLARQATILILEAEKSGGELEEIFDSATHHIQEQLDIKREREDSIRPYMFIIYISYLIFCIVVLVLFSTFFEPFGSFALEINGVDTIVIPIHAFRVFFLYLLLSQGFFSGLTAGKMGEGSVQNGVMHSSIMITMGFLFYKILIA